MKKVLCHGVFDLFHYGHLVHLKRAKQFGDFLAVSLVADRFVNKGPGRPVYDERKRAEMLRALHIVDLVVLTTGPGPENNLREIRPDYYVRGEDYRGKSTPEDKLLNELGISRVFVPSDKTRTTELLKIVRAM